MTPNQFSSASEPQKYVVEMDKSLYKLFLRLKTIDFPAEIHLYSDENGKIRSLRVFRAKDECLTGSSN